MKISAMKIRSNLVQRLVFISLKVNCKNSFTSQEQDRCFCFRYLIELPVFVPGT